MMNDTGPYILKIEPHPLLVKDYFNCFQTMLETIAFNWATDVSMMYADFYGFSYRNRPQESVGASLSPGWGSNVQYLLRNFSEIDLQWGYAESRDQLLERFRESREITGLLALNMDGYDLPWHPAYRLYHINAWMLILGYNSETQIIVCLDPHTNNDLNQLEIRQLPDSSIRYCLISRFAGCSQISPEQSMANQAERLLGRDEEGKNSFDRMIDFANSLHDFDRINQEIASATHFNNVKLFIQLKEIQNARMNMAVHVLPYLAKFNDGYNMSLIDKMKQMAMDWEKIRMSIMKYSLYSKSEKGMAKVAERIREIAAQEAQLCEDFARVNE